MATKEKNLTAEELQAENAQLKAELAAARATDIDGLHRTVGKVKLTVEDPDSGKQTADYEITPGHPQVRYAGQVVLTQDLMDAATGKKTDAGLNKDAVLDFLAAAAARGAGWLQKVSAVLMLMLCFALAMPTTADAQVNTGRFYQFDRDTSTNADTLTFLFPFSLNSNVQFEYAWQVTSTNVSGTSTATAYVQESFDGTNWVTVDTITISGTSTQFETGSTIGTRHRLYLISSGTGVTDLVAILRFRQKKV